MGFEFLKPVTESVTLV